MSKTRVQIVNFGGAHGGLSTVGYTLYNSDGSIYQARKAGAVEYGAGTGIYGALVTIPEATEIVVMWDTGVASPVYAATEGMSALNAIQESTDYIRVIWNTLKNQGEVFNDLIRRIKELKMPEIKDNDNVLSSILATLEQAREEIVSLDAIKGALNVTVNAPEVVIPEPKITVNAPEVKIPDYTEQIVTIEKQVALLCNKLDALSVTAPVKDDLSAELKAIKEIVDASKVEMSQKDSLSCDKLVAEINKLKQRIELLNAGLTAKVEGSEISLRNAVDKGTSKVDESVHILNDKVSLTTNHISNFLMTLVQPDVLHGIKQAFDQFVATRDAEIKRNRIKKVLGVK